MFNSLAPLRIEFHHFFGDLKLLKYKGNVNNLNRSYLGSENAAKEYGRGISPNHFQLQILRYLQYCEG